MSSRVRVGVIGAGAWTIAAHLPALQQRDDVDLVAVCRLGGAGLADVQRRFGFEFASEDYRDVLDRDLDAVIVASPAALHAEHATAALHAGAHVLCEKPFTLTAADAWALVEEARRQNRHVLVSLGWNLSDLVERTRALLRQRPIGHVEHLSVFMSSPLRELLTAARSSRHLGATDDAPEPATWIDPSLSGGGYGQAQLPHALGLAFGLTDERCTGAYACSYPAAGRVELHNAIVLALRGGGIATVSGTSSHAGADGNRHRLTLDIVASGGQLALDLFRERVSLFRPQDGQIELDSTPGSGVYDGSLAANRLVELAAGYTTENPVPAELGAVTVEATEAAYRSAATGTFVKVTR